VTAASDITISGLTGSQTVSGALSVSVTVDSGAVSVFESDEGQWTLGEGGSGTIVLTVASGGLTAGTPPPPSRTKWTRRVPHPVLIGHAACPIAAGTDYVIGFTLRNQADERQTAAEVRVEASVHSGAAADDPIEAKLPAPIAEEVLTNANGDIVGVVGGEAPFLLVRVAFDTKLISQSHPITGSSNLITVTLSTNYDVLPGSTLTIGGLTGTDESDNPALPIDSLPANMFGATGAWLQAGTLGLEVSTTLSADTDYVIVFWVVNGNNEQDAVTATLSLVLTNPPGGVASSGEVSPVADVNCEAPTSLHVGVNGGASPLKLVALEWDSKVVAQSCPLASASNLITVSLSPNVDPPLVLSGHAASLTPY
jgi:hypothetical protein